MQQGEFSSSGVIDGDRLQNFMRYDQNAQQVVVYRAFCGRPLVLLVAAGAAAPEQIRALQSTQLPEHAAAALIIPGSPDQAAAIARDFQLGDLTVLADDGGIIQYLVGGVPDQPHALVFDANLRLLARADADSVSAPLAEWAVNQLQAQPPSSDQVITGQAPVLVIPRVFEEAFCAELMSFFDTAGSYEAGVYVKQGDQVVFTPEPDVKIRRDHTIEDPDLTRRIQERLVRRVIPEIQWAFGYQVTRFEQFKLIRYSADTGGYFRPHRDNDSPDSAHRRFAMTLNLNTGDYSGGELRFPEYGDQRYVAQRGGAVVFSCNLAHEALDVTAGDRYALLSFFFGEAEEQQRQVQADQVPQAVAAKSQD